MTHDDMEAEINSLKVRVGALEKRVHRTEEAVDTLWTPLWKKVLFWLDGWPLYRLADARAWRPWHKRR